MAIATNPISSTIVTTVPNGDHSWPIDSKQDDDGWQIEMSDPNQATLQAGVVAACR